MTRKDLDEQLRTQATTIRTERGASQNSADRVGKLFEDIVDAIPDDGQLFNGDYKNLQNKPIFSPTVTGDITGSYEIGKIKLNGESFQTIYGIDTGEGEQGKQRTYYCNVDHEVVPTAPTIENYNSDLDKFKKDGYTWTYTNVNPSSGEDTYQISVWFRGVTPITIDGPVRIYNCELQGSNGEDSEEIEWIYFRSKNKIDYNTDGKPVTDALAAYSGVDKIENSCDFEGQVWYNHPQGIDEEGRYEYKSYRTSSLDENGKRVWGRTGFSAPILSSAYGEKGEDGDGVEYIFYATKSGIIEGINNRPNEWGEEDSGKNGKSFQDNEFIKEGSDWMDNPVDLSASSYGQGSVEWVSKREKRNGSWQTYSEPAVWSRLGKDGVVDGFIVNPTNANMPVGTDNTGKASNYSNSCLIQVFHNGDPLYYEVPSNSSSPSTGHFTYTIGTITRSDDSNEPKQPASGISARKMEGSEATVIVEITEANNFDSVNAFVPITVLLPNGTTREFTITLYGVAVGEAGAVIDLYTSSNAIRVNNAKTIATPTNLLIGVKIVRMENPSLYYSSNSSVANSAESLGYTFKYGYDSIAPAVHAGSINLEANHSSITIEMYKNGTFIDAKTLSYIADGANGRGVRGVTPYYVAMNEQVVPTIDLTTGNRTPESAGWGADKPYLYRSDYTEYTDGDSSWSTVYLYQVYFDTTVVTPAYVISTINDNAVIDDQTIGAAALETATINPIKVSKGNTDVTTNCIYKVTALSLPSGLKLQSKNGSSYADLQLNSETSVNTFTIAPYNLNEGSTLATGNYYYDITVIYEGTERGTKRFKLYIDATISTDGSFYKLSIENDTLSYEYDSTLLSTADPVIKAYKVKNDGSTEQVNVGFFSEIQAQPQYQDTLYVVIPSNSPLYEAAATYTSGGKTTVRIDRSKVSYSSNGYDITLYKGSSYVDGPEHIDCVKNGSPGSSNDGYSLIVNPPYAIFEETLIEGVKSIDVTTWSAKVQVLKGKDPQYISSGSYEFTGCTASITGNDSKTIVVKVTSILDGVVTGKISFWVTVEGSNFFNVEIPIYINRVGTWMQTIEGDVETTIMEKTIFRPDDDTVVTFNNLGTYLRTSAENVAILQENVNGIENSVSEISQTANSISLSVNSGWINYIANPLAEKGDIRNIVTDSDSIIEDDLFGRVLQFTAPQVTNPDNSGYQLLHSIKAEIEDSELKNGTFTWFCIVKFVDYVGTDTTARLCFGSGTSGNQDKALVISTNKVNRKVTVSSALTNPTGSSDNLYYDFSTFYSTITPISNEWYLCSTTVKFASKGYILAGDNVIGFCKSQGTWQIYYAGIVKGAGCPTVEMIRNNVGFQKAGIDITNGKIKTQADNFEWVNNNNETVLGMNDMGDAEFSGTIKAKNFYHGVCINGQETYAYLTQEFIDDYGSDPGAEEWINNFEVGKYYSAQQISDLSRGEIDSGVQSHGVIACTYSADVVIVPNRYNNTSNTSNNRIVCLPCAEDFPGKIVEIIDCAYVQPSSGYTLSDIEVIAADSGDFGGGIYYSDDSYRVARLNNYAVITGGTKGRFYSVEDSTGWWWLRIE